jgi:hypothetical protein
MLSPVHDEARESSVNKRYLVSVLGAFAAISAIVVPGAAAATEFGDNCVANRASSPPSPATLFALTGNGDPLPLTAPSAGVITKWKLNLVSEAAGSQIPQTLKVLRPSGPKSVQIVGDSAQSVTGGSNSFDTRIPVQVGDRLGLFASPGEFGLLYCEEEGGPKNRVGAFEGSAGVGSSATYEEGEGEIRIPAVGVIEPDADNDGYGDETQDKCPQNASVQIPCPTVALSSSLVVKKGLLKVLVTTNVQASVTVKGTVKAGKGKTIKLSGGTQVVIPGTIARFTVLFTKGLKTKLSELSSKQSLPLKLSITAPNLVGAPSSKIFKKKLRGQTKPKPHKKAKAHA